MRVSRSVVTHKQGAGQGEEGERGDKGFTSFSGAAPSGLPGTG